jgi:hypothetical protein
VLFIFVISCFLMFMVKVRVEAQSYDISTTTDAITAVLTTTTAAGFTDITTTAQGFTQVDI